MFAKYRVLRNGSWKTHRITRGQELPPAELAKLATPDVRAIWFREGAIVGVAADGTEVELNDKGESRESPPPLPEEG